jgi:beta-phosphoglucomutase-like phosphatase (HAD superfamily)
MKLVSRMNAIIYGKDNPEGKPDPTVCRANKPTM